ncbi:MULTISPECIES: MarR family winged helix-turn-helix transcriptional regulator [unclassified Nocardioides]|uniref:MarR family winged helix-turn-helix transcriptional regulator n=1 Tax=unclassified Nocardioides TaxID=2615069 RepID=UPI000702CFD5|nr:MULTISPECIES: MarR family transcriptional regulator [unclassified Nocardioides]KRC46455.1 MarR family transcriptional regulator [Nocardioides sp. Root79]KRC69799.1 MarR family transcriptional regulator [Nocardioides sp. Root240]
MSNRVKKAPVRRAGAGVDGVDAVEADWRRERPDIDVSSIGVVTRVWRVGRYLDRVRNDRLSDWDTDRATIDILAMLRRAGEPYRQSAGQLTKHSLITSGGVSQRLDKLERAGLISRHLDVNDRRRVDVQLTPEGMKLIDSVFHDVVHNENDLLGEIFDADETEQLRGLLRKFLLHFEPSGAVRAD